MWLFLEPVLVGEGYPPCGTQAWEDATVPSAVGICFELVSLLRPEQTSPSAVITLLLSTKPPAPLTRSVGPRIARLLLP